MHKASTAGGLEKSWRNRKKSSVAVSQSVARHKDGRGIWDLVGREDHKFFCPNGSIGESNMKRDC